MTLDNMTGITEGSYTGFCKSQLITCNRVKECNGVCPFEDALKHADKEMDEQNVIDHDRDWIIGCLQHDGFIHTHRFDDLLATDRCAKTHNHRAQQHNPGFRLHTGGNRLTLGHKHAQNDNAHKLLSVLCTVHSRGERARCDLQSFPRQACSF